MKHRNLTRRYELAVCSFLVIGAALSACANGRAAPPESTVTRGMQEHAPTEEGSSAVHDFGDAPDGEITGYETGAEIGRFPSSPETGGSAHDLSGEVWLGDMITGENVRHPTNDPADDGVLNIDLNSCAPSNVFLLINVSGLAAAERSEPVYLNLFFDWNLDGVWEGADECAEEWAVQDLDVDLTAWEHETAFVLELPQFTAGEHVDELWYRIVVSRQPMSTAGSDFHSGETEDYLHVAGDIEQASGMLAALALRSSSEWQARPTEPVYTCSFSPAAIRHGGGSLQAHIVQDVPSRRARRGRLNTGSLRADRAQGPLDPSGRKKPGNNIGEQRTFRSPTQGRPELTIELRVNHTADAPARVEGPLQLLIPLSGSTGTDNRDWHQEVPCVYYVFHTAIPIHESANIIDRNPRNHLYVLPHGKRKVITASDPNGRYDADSLITFSGSFGSANQVDWNGSVQVPRNGRGLAFTAVKDDRENLEMVVVVVNGVDGKGAPITDIYRVFFYHGTKRAFQEQIEGLFIESIDVFAPKTEAGEESPAGKPASGVYGVEISVKSDPSGHEGYVAMSPVLELDITIEGTNISITGSQPWIDLSGTIQQDGSFSASGTGLVAGYSGIAVTLEGLLSNGELSAELVMGAQGGLPTSRPITYTVEGGRLSPSGDGSSQADVDLVIAFAGELEDAIHAQDTNFLIDRLHAEISSMYGAEQCESYLRSIEDPSFNIEVLSVSGPEPWTLEADGRTASIPDVYTVDAEFTTQDQVERTSLHFALADERLHWFVDCGDPIPDP